MISYRQTTFIFVFLFLFIGLAHFIVAPAVTTCDNNILTSGTYWLDGNITCGPDTNYFLYDSNVDNVTFDGNGYTIDWNGSQNAFYTSNADNITLKNFDINGNQRDYIIYNYITDSNNDINLQGINLYDVNNYAVYNYNDCLDNTDDLTYNSFDINNLDINANYYGIYNEYHTDKNYNTIAYNDFKVLNTKVMTKTRAIWDAEQVGEWDSDYGYYCSVHDNNTTITDSNIFGSTQKDDTHDKSIDILNINLGTFCNLYTHTTNISHDMINSTTGLFYSTVVNGTDSNIYLNSLTMSDIVWDANKFAENSMGLIVNIAAFKSSGDYINHSARVYSNIVNLNNIVIYTNDEILNVYDRFLDQNNNWDNNTFVNNITKVNPNTNGIIYHYDNKANLFISNSDMNNFSLDKVTLLSDSNIYDSDVNNSNIQNIDIFRDSKTYNTDVNNSDMNNITANGGNIYNVDINNSDFNNTNLLTNATIYNTDFNNSNVQDSNIYNVDFQSSDVNNCTLRENESNTIIDTNVRNSTFLNYIFNTSANQSNILLNKSKITFDLNTYDNSKTVWDTIDYKLQDNNASKPDTNLSSKSYTDYNKSIFDLSVPLSNDYHWLFYKYTDDYNNTYDPFLYLKYTYLSLHFQIENNNTNLIPDKLLINGTDRSSEIDETGNFHISLPPSKITIHIEKLGYLTKDLTLYLDKNQTYNYNIELTPIVHRFYEAPVVKNISVNSTSHKFEIQKYLPLKFKYKDENHTIELKDVNFKTATVMISSTPKTYVLMPGVITKVDLDKDNIPDIALKLDPIENVFKVNVTMYLLPKKTSEKKSKESAKAIVSKNIRVSKIKQNKNIKVIQKKSKVSFFVDFPKNINLVKGVLFEKKVHIKNITDFNLNNVQLEISGIPSTSYTIMPHKYSTILPGETKKFNIVFKANLDANKYNIKFVLLSNELQSDVNSVLIVNAQISNPLAFLDNPLMSTGILTGIVLVIFFLILLLRKAKKTKKQKKGF